MYTRLQNYAGEKLVSSLSLYESCLWMLLFICIRFNVCISNIAAAATTTTTSHINVTTATTTNNNNINNNNIISSNCINNKNYNNNNNVNKYI